ncbi:MAG: C1 family peptidase [Gammaproteobacteria bacterium]|nr:C1 family peptidase [Gammaproteobacteria bacterium]
MKINKLFLATLCVSTASFAGQPVWTFAPTTVTSVVFPTNVTSSIVYIVSNQSSQSHTLVIKPIQGITQIGACVLAPKGQTGDSCTLNLSVTGSQLPASGISGGPILCQSNNNGSPNLSECYQPSPGDTLNITVGPPISESVDWRARGVVTPVKNQGDCLSSYAFSTTGAVEGFYAIHSGNLRSFSEQQIVDCSENSGCDGGTVLTSLQYIINAGGIALEFQYPYTARQGICRNVSNVNVDVNKFIQVPPKNEIALAEQVEQQPVSAMISIGPWFQSYSGGAINPDCSTDTEYQNVLIVGYTSTYWIIKNSYGSSWGSRGYLYLTRGINACGIANEAFAPS